MAGQGSPQPKKPWTASEETVLMSLHGQGLSQKAMGEALGRSAASVAQRLQRLKKQNQEHLANSSVRDAKSPSSNAYVKTDESLSGDSLESIFLKPPITKTTGATMEALPTLGMPLVLSDIAKSDGAGADNEGEAGKITKTIITMPAESAAEQAAEAKLELAAPPKKAKLNAADDASDTPHTPKVNAPQTPKVNPAPTPKLDALPALKADASLSIGDMRELAKETAALKAERDLLTQKWQLHSEKIKRVQLMQENAKLKEEVASLKRKLSEVVDSEEAEH